MSKTIAKFISTVFFWIEKAIVIYALITRPEWSKYVGYFMMLMIFGAFFWWIGTKYKK